MYVRMSVSMCTEKCQQGKQQEYYSLIKESAVIGAQRVRPSQDNMIVTSLKFKNAHRSIFTVVTGVSKVSLWAHPGTCNCLCRAHQDAHAQTCISAHLTQKVASHV